MYVMGAGALVVAALAIPAAISWHSHPIAGVLLDPNAVVSSLSSPKWDGPRQGLRFPDRIVSVGNSDLSALPGNKRGRKFDTIVNVGAAAGLSEIPVVVERDAAQRGLKLKITRLDSGSWWSTAGSLLLAGALWITAGMIALWVNPSGRLSRTFGLVSASSGLFVLCLFDYHTTRWMVPLFYLAFAMVPGSICILAMRLPDDVGLLRRAPWIEKTAVGLGLSMAFLLTGVSALGGLTTGLQIVWSFVFGAAFLFFAVTLLVRFLRATGNRRDTLRALLVALVVPHAVVGALVGVAPIAGAQATSQTLVYPALSLGPIATAYAFVRYDLWGSRSVLSRILTRLFVGAALCGIAVAVGAALASELGAPFHWAVVAATASGVAATVLVVLGLHASEQLLFPARAEFKPTVEQLSEELTGIASTEAVGRAIVATVKRWLPCDHIALELNLNGSKRNRSAPPKSSYTADLAEPRPRAAISPDSAELSLPITFGREHLGQLQVGSKRGGALFTTDDIDLLSTIANQGALALAHARAYQELEQRRRQQAEAWRGEREALVETVAAEIAHEIRYPINFFRSLFEHASAQALGAEDIDIGREEVERLERLVAGLRRMAAHRLQRRVVSLRDLCAHAEVLLRDGLEGRTLTVTGDPSLAVRCDADQITQVLVNLIANALQVTQAGGDVGVDWTREPSGATLTVWDTGPGFLEDPATLFAPWYTTRERGTGLGLAITHRLVRAHGWNIEARRDHGRTVFVIAIRDADIVRGEADPNSNTETEVA